MVSQLPGRCLHGRPTLTSGTRCCVAPGRRRWLAWRVPSAPAGGLYGRTLHPYTVKDKHRHAGTHRDCASHAGRKKTEFGHTAVWPKSFCRARLPCVRARARSPPFAGVTHRQALCDTEAPSSPARQKNKKIKKKRKIERSQSPKREPCGGVSGQRGARRSAGGAAPSRSACARACGVEQGHLIADPRLPGGVGTQEGRLRGARGRADC